MAVTHDGIQSLNKAIVPREGKDKEMNEWERLVSNMESSGFEINEMTQC